MKKILLFAIALICFFSSAFAQTSVKYFEYIDKANSFYKLKEYKKSAALYTSAFKLNEGKAYSEDRYDASRAWTLAGNKDSAFFQLFKIVTLYNYSDYTQITTDAAFNSLHTDNRWASLLEIIKQNIGADSNLNSKLVILLDSVYRDHHSYRLTEISLKNDSSARPEEIKAIQKKITQKDSVNLKIVTSIIDTYGWLGRDIVGFIGNYTLALIMQNADLKTQEKYLPMIREAFKNKNVGAYDMALIEDRIALREGRKQTYGSVILNIHKNNYVAPVEDPEQLDKRRTQMGLKPMNEYLANWGMRWDLNTYKKDLLLLEKEKIEY